MTRELDEDTNLGSINNVNKTQGLVKFGRNNNIVKCYNGYNRFPDIIKNIFGTSLWCLL